MVKQQSKIKGEQAEMEESNITNRRTNLEETQRRKTQKHRE